jgi:2-polyprenyl-6-methoxyphenol hydroxylase-like FAD-dependent oxidoreductase
MTLNTHHGRDHAVVMGSSMAGLLAARVLSEHFGQVTIVERDALPGIGEHRKGVPQARHVHGIHPRGREILEELIPGFTATLARAGAVGGDVLGDLRWQLSGFQLCQAHIGLPVLLASRPLIEGHVRAFVRQLPRVSILEQRSVAGLATTAGGGRITGVHVHQAHPPAGLTDLPADFVVDATGRGSRTPRWLSELGYQPPGEDRVEIGLGYATRNYRLRPGATNGDHLILTGATPANPRYGVLAAAEGGRHILTLAGMRGDHPPIDPEGFDRFAASLPRGDISAAIAGAAPVDDPVPFRFPASVRRRYERLRRFPTGLLVIGDAVCSFNPVYGQGLTVAAMQALALQRLLANGAAAEPRRYFRAIAAPIDVAWDLAATADLAFSAVPGKRTVKVRLTNAYLPRVHAAATHDAKLAGSLVRVIGMKDRPETLLRPGPVLRTLRGSRQARRADATATADAARIAHDAGPREPSPAQR